MKYILYLFVNSRSAHIHLTFSGIDRYELFDQNPTSLAL